MTSEVLLLWQMRELGLSQSRSGLYLIQSEQEKIEGLTCLINMNYIIVYFKKYIININVVNVIAQIRLGCFSKIIIISVIIDPKNFLGC